MIIKRLLFIVINFMYDMIAYIKHSSVFNYRNQNKVEGKIAFYYHSIEKGLANSQVRYKFGELKIKKLIKYLNIWVQRQYDTNNTQFISACSVLAKYCKLHEEHKVDISHIVKESDFDLFESYNNERLGGVIDFHDSNYFNHTQDPFDIFSKSRHSVRHFQDKEIPVSIINNVASISRSSPSVCNRQSVRLIFLNNSDLVQKVLRIQSGLNESKRSVNQLFVVISDRNYFVSEGERNQLYIDGGIFLMNLLYSLHFYNIAACPLHCALNIFDELKIKKLLKMKQSEKLIALVAVGYTVQQFKVPFSNRKDITEILEIICE